MYRINESRYIMKKVLSKLKHNTLFGFIIGIILCSGIVYGSNVYQSSAIEYSPTDSSWNVSNVSDAINSLHSMVKELENIKSIGDATAAQILSGKKAVVKGSTITGAMTNRGAWTNTPTESGKVTIPEGYHDGNGYVDTATAYTNGYNAGVAAADARANSNSANYQAGYNAGVAAALNKTGTATATIKKQYNDNASSTYTLTVSVGSYSKTTTAVWGDNANRSTSASVSFKLQ